MSTTEELAFDMVCERRYWANPANYYHDEYHSSVNRVFVTFVAVLSLVFAYSNFGFLGLTAAFLTTVVVVFAAALALWAVFALLFTFVDGISKMFHWLSGAK